MRIRLTLAGAALAAVTVIAAAPVAGATDGPAVPKKADAKADARPGAKADARPDAKDGTKAESKDGAPDLGFAAIPGGNRELVGRIMTGLG
ncbi:hypothetical protein ACH4FX_31665 [Streptomyces sp. NPDC018019]|uniref:hypothetical protein n=1 Tax=Streptomyces sp. NPDC018019 TaxID=3365030 RepID=UPI0037995C7A